MVFECQQCGECCHYMGQVHTTKEIHGEFEFLVNNQYTGEKTGVIVDQDKYNLFEDQSIFWEQPEACPFLKNHPKDGKAYYTVHLTRLEICRDYGCWRHSGYRSLHQGTWLLVAKIWEPCGFDQDLLIRLTDFFKDQ